MKPGHDSRVGVAAFLPMLILAAIAGAAESKVKGHLVIVGGGKHPPEVLRRFVELSGGTRSAKILVIPMASSEPEKTGSEEVAEFKRIGITNVQSVLLTRQQCSDPAVLSGFDGVTGIFFSGGDQSVLARVLVGTGLHGRLKALHRDGAVIGGTSAGAAIMSRVMITGEETSPRNVTEKFTSIRQGNVVTAEGLGFLTNAVIDQHFVARKRLNRLFSVVLENPQLLGIGIDEDTAIVVNPDDTFEVLGQNSAMVLNARGAGLIRHDATGNLAGNQLRVDLLLAGDRFDLVRGIVVGRAPRAAN